MTDTDSTHDDSTQDRSHESHESRNDSTHLSDVQGVVKWFDPRKGFGFIVGPDQQDIFVHFTVIEGDGFRVLKDGSSVNYNAEKNDKGWRATKIHQVNENQSDGHSEHDHEDAPEVVVPRRTYSRTPRR